MYKPVAKKPQYSVPCRTGSAAPRRRSSSTREPASLQENSRRIVARTVAAVVGMVAVAGLLVGTAGSASASCNVWYFDVNDIPRGAHYVTLAFDDGDGPYTIYEVTIPGDDVFCGT
jgi:hypothetical protein